MNILKEQWIASALAVLPLGLLAYAAPSDAASLGFSVISGSTTANPGDIITFKTTLNVSDVDDLTGLALFNYSISYNASELEFVSGGGFSGTLQDPAPLGGINANFANFTTLLSVPGSGIFQLDEITFRFLDGSDAAGADFSVEANVAVGQFPLAGVPGVSTFLPFDVSSPSGIEITPILPGTTPIPEPMTILGSIFALGFGAALKRQHGKKSQLAE